VVSTLLVGAAGLAAAVAAELRGQRAWAVLGCAVTALLISPVSWSHHWVWCVPLVLLLAVRGHRAGAAGTLLVFCSYALWWVPHGAGRPELSQGAAELLLSGLYAAAGCGFLLRLPRAALRPSRTSRTA
jgi:alpha-1,2-mannosyltransferase